MIPLPSVHFLFVVIADLRSSVCSRLLHSTEHLLMQLWLDRGNL